MADFKTMLIDPQSVSSSNSPLRAVFRIPAGSKFLARKLRLCNFGFSNASGNAPNGSGDSMYFGHNGIYSIIQKISVDNLDGVEIDRLDFQGVNIMGLRLAQLSNSTEFSVGRALSQQMCNSIFVPSFSQTVLTEEHRRDDATLMGNSIYIDISAMLTYLQTRQVIDEGLVIQVEFQDPAVLGYNFTFTRPPCLAVDYVLNPDIKVDEGDEFGYVTIVPDRLLLTGSEGQPIVRNQRLQSYFNQYVRNLYYFNVGRQNNTLQLPLSRPNELCNLFINGVKLLPLNGIDTSAKKLMYLNDMSAKTNITHYSSYADGLLGMRGLYNPNLGLSYSNDATVIDENLGSVFSWGCIRVDKNIGQDMILEYQTALASAQPPSTVNSDTLVFLAEIARKYNKRTGVVSYL
jgi:hypothetical protein